MRAQPEERHATTRAGRRDRANAVRPLASAVVLGLCLLGPAPAGAGTPTRPAVDAERLEAREVATQDLALARRQRTPVE